MGAGCGQREHGAGQAREQQPALLQLPTCTRDAESEDKRQ